MAEKKEKKQLEKVRTPVGRFSFCYFYQKASGTFKDGKKVKEEFKTDFLIPLERNEELKPLKQKCLKVAREKFGADLKWSELKTPFKDGNTLYEKDPEKYAAYKDQTYFKAATTFDVDIVGVGEKGEAVELDDSEPQVKAGDYGRLSLTLKPYEMDQEVLIIENGKRRKETAKQKGVTFYLSNVQLTRRGEALAVGGTSGKDDFDVEPLNPEELGDIAEDEEFEEEEATEEVAAPAAEKKPATPKKAKAKEPDVEEEEEII